MRAIVQKNMIAEYDCSDALRQANNASYGDNSSLDRIPPRLNPRRMCCPAGQRIATVARSLISPVQISPVQKPSRPVRDRAAKYHWDHRRSASSPHQVGSFRSVMARLVEDRAEFVHKILG
jgi:hypothetical protein